MDEFIFVVLRSERGKVVEYDLFDTDDQAQAYERRLAEHPCFRDGATIDTFFGWCDTCLEEKPRAYLRQAVARDGPNPNQTGQLGLNL